MTRIFLIPAVLAVLSLAGLGMALLGGEDWSPAAWIGGFAPLAALGVGIWRSLGNGLPPNRRRR